MYGWLNSNGYFQGKRNMPEQDKNMSKSSGGREKHPIIENTTHERVHLNRYSGYCVYVRPVFLGLKITDARDSESDLHSPWTIRSFILTIGRNTVNNW